MSREDIEMMMADEIAWSIAEWNDRYGQDYDVLRYWNTIHQRYWARERADRSATVIAFPMREPGDDTDP